MNAVAAYSVNACRRQNVVIGAGGLLSLQPRLACQGYSKLMGTLHFNANPAGGITVGQYGDQTTAAGASHFDTLAAVANADGTFTFDILLDVVAPYFSIDVSTVGGGGVTCLEALCVLRGAGS